MFDWVRGWWANGAVAFDARAYKRYAVDRRAHSDLVRWDVFRCHPFTFEFRYVADDAGRHFNLVDFCKGLQISHDLLPRCRWDCARHLNELRWARLQPRLRSSPRAACLPPNTASSNFCNNCRSPTRSRCCWPFVRTGNATTCAKKSSRC
ncbi:38.7k N-terminal [Philosamia cynthia ricini nucleopolyhedrovirus virus]|nr:38.7k N-terminal [Philosamia cynthia ricini nucleopolyhedrovirus virus]